MFKGNEKVKNMETSKWVTQSKNKAKRYNRLEELNEWKREKVVKKRRQRKQQKEETAGKHLYTDKRNGFGKD